MSTSGSPPGTIRGARAAARERAWDARARPEMITFGIDGTLLVAASETEEALGALQGLGTRDRASTREHAIGG